MATVEAVPREGGKLARAFGPLTAWRVIALLAAFTFLGGAVGFALGERDPEPLNAADVGFMQDMSLHHEQAIQMSLLLLGKDDVDFELQRYAQEIIMSQRFEQGIFNATLDRFGHPTDPGETVMGWMGGGEIAAEEMPGLATEEQMDELADAGGVEAAALWIALMSEHHLGGMHMADWAARHGHDPTTVNLAKAVVEIQRDEVLEIARYRVRNDVPIPEGFSDPTQDPRMTPLALTVD